MIEYLILDYNRPTEARALLESIKKYSSFEYSVSYLSNGGPQDYVKKLHTEGFIDNLILNNRNTGCGGGTIQLFSQCETEYAFYIQVDHILSRPLEKEFIGSCINLLQNGIHCIDLAGNQGNPHYAYSERAQFINVEFYNSIPKCPGGPGPWGRPGIEWTEKSVQDYFSSNGLQIAAPAYDAKNNTDYSFVTYPLTPSSRHLLSPAYFRDAGKFSMRSNPDGSEWRQQSDTKQIWMISPPSLKHGWPHFSDQEWEEILKTKSWPDGKIPEDMKKHSFTVPDTYWLSYLH
jgi:hypothetical protein